MHVCMYVCIYIYIYDMPYYIMYRHSAYTLLLLLPLLLPLLLLPLSLLPEVFICTKGRAEVGLLHWRAPHCLGEGSKLGDAAVPVVLVVEPQEEERYRAAWPRALMLVLPRAAETAIGFSRWAVQAICTDGRDETTGEPFRLPFVWMADDLLVAFYKWERPFGESGRQVLRALSNCGFREAFLAVQRHPDIAKFAVAGFLRDRGINRKGQSKIEWLMDRTLSLQKIVLLNLPRLQELGVEYCPHLRLSEDLVICYDVARRPGGHILKAR